MTRTQQSYQEITEAVLELLREGVVPWRKPWNVPAWAPRNLLSKKLYRGINPWILNCRPFTSPFWLTFRQAKRLGGHVRKGERSTPIWFWKIWTREDPDKLPGEMSSRDRDGIPILRRYRVFNVEQCDGLERKIPELPGDVRTEWERLEAAERIVSEMPNPPSIEHGHRGAHYHPASDTVEMPDRDRFEDPAGYYSSLYHELIHASGHVSRLDRPGIMTPVDRDDPIYCREELIAEMGSAYLAGEAGIVEQTIEPSAAYLAHWILKLNDDPKLVLQAASAAQKAADFILGRDVLGEGESGASDGSEQGFERAA